MGDALGMVSVVQTLTPTSFTGNQGCSESHRAGSFILQLHSSCSSLICESMKIIVYQAGNRERKSLKEPEKKEEERRDREGFNWIGMEESVLKSGPGWPVGGKGRIR